MTRLPSESAGPRGQLWTAALVALWEQRRGSRPREGAARDPRGASKRPAARGTPSPGLHDGASPPPEFETFEDFGLILSTLNVALLVALLVIYARMYSQTGANFALGLVLVLGALLAETIVGSPLLFRLFDVPPGGQTPFLLIAETFKAAALTIFLYLSLQ